MLLIRALSSPAANAEYFDKFDPMKQTWVVPDGASKKVLHQSLVTKYGFIEEQSVFSASDFWSLLLRRTKPEYDIISQGLTRVIITQFLSERDFPWARTPGASEVACRYVRLLMPVLSHPNGREVIQTWFDENQDAYRRWGHWFVECFYLWKRFLDHKMIAGEWVSGLLTNHEGGFENFWDRDLIFDLGPSMLSVEAELISHLSKHLEVTVIEPRPDWQSEFEKNFAPYRHLSVMEKTKEEFDKKPVGEMPPNRRYLKMTTKLAEVKQAAATVRKWLDSGVDASLISIVAPEIKVYWPTLSAYLKEEGIPVRRDQKAMLSSFPEVARWLSRLKIAAGNLSRGSLELALYGGSNAKPLTFDKFKVLFGVVYGEDDLDRHPDIKKIFSGGKIDLKEKMGRDVFLSWALSHCRDGEPLEHLEAALRGFLSDCPFSLKMPAKAWLDHLITSANAERNDFRIEIENIDGVRCLDLAASVPIASTHTVFIGLTEKALRRDEQVSILPKDLFSLNQSLGFNLPVLEDSKSEFQARWLLEDTKREFVLTVPMSDFEGAVETPSLFWLSGATHSGTDTHKVNVPENSRWDEMQTLKLDQLSKVRRWTAERSGIVAQSVSQDLGVEKIPAFGHNNVKNLSASAIEDFLNCPFIFASKKIFKLSDLPSVDLDIDHMTRGKLVHAIFEDLVSDNMKFDLTDDEIIHVIEKCREKQEIVLGDEKMWLPMRTRYVTVAKKFLAFEKEWRNRFPMTKTVGREMKVAGIVTRDGQIKKEGEGYVFRGSIDRVDTDGSGRAVVIDYKSTKGSSVINYPKWVEKNILQLALYSIAVEEGLTEMGPTEVAGAVYYVVKTLTREHGFLNQDHGGVLFDAGSRKNSTLDTNEKKELFEQTREKLKSVLQQLQSGSMNPTPFKITDCQKCQWRYVCRAPHLL